MKTFSNILVFRSVLLFIIGSQLVEGFVVKSDNANDQQAENTQFFSTAIVATIGAHLWSFLSGCFLNMDNLNKLFFPK
ncbi:unnamed protein product [Heterobilharzia americana]|nr:unnamed protein product [Heterobilharzia americana]CAH8625888.1 unnamed protein product [Heterobilharzia americana]